jgi:hypothetical protein
MRRVTVIALLAGMALSVAPMPAAHAGSRGIGAGDSLLCYTISDPAPGHIVELSDNVSVGPRLATVGAARFLCVSVTGAICDSSQPCTDPRGNLVQGPSANSSFPPATNFPSGIFKCYALRSSAGDNPDTVVTLSDTFQQEPNVPLGSSQLLCVETGVEIVSGP